MNQNLICTNMEPSPFQDLQHLKLKQETPDICLNYVCDVIWFGA